MNVTTTLLLLLNQDLLILNKLLDDITKTNDLSELKSWLFPLKPHYFVSQIISNKAFKNPSYETCLEVTLDRLYVLIKFFLEFIHNSKQVRKNVLTRQPKNPTLGLCVQLLWDNISKLMEKEATKKTAMSLENHNLCIDKQAQTDNISLNNCDSCSSAIICMKRLLKTFENQQDRIKIKYQIFDITQFGCMLKVTSSIEEALNNLYKQLHREKTEKETLKLENDHFNTKLKEKDARVVFLEEEVNILRTQLERDAQDILMLRQEQKKLSKEVTSGDNKINILKETVNNFSIGLQATKKKNNTLENENNLLKSNLETSTNILWKFNKGVADKLLLLDKEYDVIKCIIEQYDKSLACLNIRLIKLAKSLGKTELKLKSSFESTNETSQDFLKCETFCIKIKEVLQKKIDNIKNPPEVIPIKGNPIEDISKQIEENKSKIQDLENENVRLQKLLVRLKNIPITK